jgi:hypothetical protein
MTTKAVNERTLIDAGVNCENGKVIKCDIKPGSVERFRDVYMKDICDCDLVK